jgi:S-DNA-T family DNA segregation ATPase FtsK/SpoIIIE
VDLILGQGMLKAGWDEHNLNAPGKFPVPAPGHDRAKWARAYLLTDQAVTETAAPYSGYRPELDTESRRAVIDAAYAHPGQDEDPAGESVSPGAGEPTGRQPTMAEQTLWMALVMAPYEGIGVGDLMNATGMTRPTIYRHLREYIRTGHVMQVSRGRWRASPDHRATVTVSDRPTGRLVSPSRARVCTSRAKTGR